MLKWPRPPRCPLTATSAFAGAAQQLVAKSNSRPPTSTFRLLVFPARSPPPVLVVQVQVCSYATANFTGPCLVVQAVRPLVSQSPARLRPGRGGCTAAVRTVVPFG